MQRRASASFYGVTHGTKKILRMFLNVKVKDFEVLKTNPFPTHHGTYLTMISEEIVLL